MTCSECGRDDDEDDLNMMIERPTDCQGRPTGEQRIICEDCWGCLSADDAEHDPEIEDLDD